LVKALSILIGRSPLIIEKYLMEYINTALEGKYLPYPADVQVDNGIFLILSVDRK
jgi:hypothetical protein